MVIGLMMKYNPCLAHPFRNSELIYFLDAINEGRNQGYRIPSKERESMNGDWIDDKI